MESSHPPFLFDQPCLVALSFLWRVASTEIILVACRQSSAGRHLQAHGPAPGSIRPRPGFALTVCGVLLLGVPGALANRVPLLDHVIVIVMENKSYDEVRTAPYTASLVASGTSFSNSFAVTHPSQPNYLA